MPAPANNNWADAILITTDTGSSSLITIDEATREAGEPGLYDDRPFKTLWWKFVAGSSGTAIISTAGSVATDENSGSSSTPPYGELDTFLRVYTGASLAGLTVVTPGGSNDDFLDLTSQVSITVVEGTTYYIQAGLFAANYNGQLQLNWTLPRTFTHVEIGECPHQVVFQGHGNHSVQQTPQFGTPGYYTDGYLEWYEPVHIAGRLLVWIYSGDKTDVGVPSGYTAVLNEVWDDCPPGSTFNGQPGPFYNLNSQLIIAYRITTTSGGGGTPVGTVGNFKYSGDTANWWTDQYLVESGVISVEQFSLEHMTPLFPEDPDAWPANPVKVGPLDWTPGVMLEDPELTNDTGATVWVDPPDADWIGNHIWMTVFGSHGIVQAGDILEENSPTEDLFSVDPAPPSDVFPPSWWIGDRYNDSSWYGWVSNKSYFVNGPNDIIWRSSFPEGAQSFTVYAADSYLDGFIGTLHVDFEDWAIRGGAFAVNFVVQGPEDARPFNDALADAYTVPTCPIVIKECVWGQTAEGGEAFPEGNPNGTSVWFKLTPTTTETGIVIKTWTGAPDYENETTYNTVLAVYDSTMTLIVSNDDFSGHGTLSQVEVDLTGGATYFIQVAGWSADEGELFLTIDCAGIIEPYWGILATAM